MMTFLKGAFSILFGLSFCLPLTLKLFLPGVRSIIQILSTTFGLSIGFLTLLIAYLSTFYRPFFNLYGIIIPAGIFFLFFFIWIVKDGKSFQLSENEVVDFLSSSPTGFFWRVPILLICVFIFWSSIYYPFVTQDAITTYASAAKNIYLSGGMEEFHIPHFRGHFDSYPLLVPLSYVHNYFAFGEIDEHAAKVIPGLFSIGF